MISEYDSMIKMLEDFRRIKTLRFEEDESFITFSLKNKNYRVIKEDYVVEVEDKITNEKRFVSFFDFNKQFFSIYERVNWEKYKGVAFRNIEIDTGQGNGFIYEQILNFIISVKYPVLQEPSFDSDEMLRFGLELLVGDISMIDDQIFISKDFDGRGLNLSSHLHFMNRDFEIVKDCGKYFLRSDNAKIPLSDFFPKLLDFYKKIRWEKYKRRIRRTGLNFEVFKQSVNNKIRNIKFLPA